MKHEFSRLGKKVKHDPLNCFLRQKFNIVKKIIQETLETEVEGIC